MNNPADISNYPPASLMRRLGAMFYDSLLLISVLLLATGLAVLITKGSLDSHHPIFRSYLFLVCFAFYAGFWMHGGQTLGMRTWRLRVQRMDGQPLTLWQVLLRFLCAIPSIALLGMGLFWMLFDRDRLAWHDRFSESVIVQLPK